MHRKCLPNLSYTSDILSAKVVPTKYLKKVVRNCEKVKLEAEPQNLNS